MAIKGTKEVGAVLSVERNQLVTLCVAACVIGIFAPLTQKGFKENFTQDETVGCIDGANSFE